MRLWGVCSDRFGFGLNQHPTAYFGDRYVIACPGKELPTKTRPRQLPSDYKDSWERTPTGRVQLKKRTAADDQKIEEEFTRMLEAARQSLSGTRFSSTAHAPTSTQKNVYTYTQPLETLSKLVRGTNPRNAFMCFPGFKR